LSIPSFTDESNDIQEDDNEIILNRNSHYRLKPYAKHLQQKERVIEHYSQLTKLDKELVKVAFREACLKGFTINQIPDFIYIKTKLNVSINLVKNLRRMQLNDDRYWFYELARDQYAYVSAYRQAIDEVSLCKKQLWSIIMDSDTEPNTKISAIRELHQLIKTNVLLLRDLPFVVNLSKYFDISKLDPDGSGLKKLGQTHSTSFPSNQTEFHTHMERPLLDNVNSNLVNTILNKLNEVIDS